MAESAHPDGPSPECRLVFLAAQGERATPAITALLGAPLDWTRVATIAERELATAPLWHLLERHAASLVPTDVAAHLRRSSAVHDFRMNRLASRLAPAIDAVRRRGVAVLLLKGAAVAIRSGRGFTARPMTDVDLLVTPGEVSPAAEALIEAGWPMTTDPVLLDLLRHEHHLPHFVDPGNTGLRVELHTRLLPPDEPFDIHEAEVWRSSSPAPAPFEGARIAAPRFLMLHACVHFAWSHSMRFGAWRTFHDVMYLANDPAFDWREFTTLAARVKGSSSCYWTLRLARRLAGADVPDAVLHELEPPSPGWLQAALERHFIAAIVPGEGPPCPSLQLSRLLWISALRPRWSGFAHAGRYDPQQKWARALGTVSTETRGERFLRHLAGFRHWWRFAMRTFLNRPAGTVRP